MPSPAPLPTATAGLALACALLACAGASGGGTAGPAAGGPPAGATAPAPEESPGAVLERFVDALEGGRFGQAAGLLSARWRAVYTPGRLAADYAGAGPLAREAAARVRAALRGGALPQVGDGRAELPVVGGRALLVAEAGGWRVEALE